jgi:hypothetical protein
MRSASTLQQQSGNARRRSSQRDVTSQANFGKKIVLDKRLARASGPLEEG